MAEDSQRVTVDGREIPDNTGTSEELDRVLECPVCQEQFRDPTILPCGHTFCLQPCLEAIAGAKTTVACPECRAQHVTPAGGITGFPKNFTVLRQVDSTVDETKPIIESTGCPLCGEEDELGKCGHCGMFLCECCRMRHIPLLKQKVRELADQTTQKAAVEAEACTELAKCTEASAMSHVDAALLHVDSLSQSVVSALKHKTDELKSTLEVIRQQEMGKISETTDFAKKLWKNLSDMCAETTNQVTGENVIMSQSKLVKLGGKLSDEHLRASDMNTRAIGTIRVMENPNLQINMDVSGVIDVIQGFALAQIAIQNPQDGSKPKAKTQSNIPEKKPHDTHQQISDKDLSNIKLRFGSAGSQRGEFLDPSSVAVDSRGDIVVVDTGNNRIQRFDSSGGFQLSIDQLSQPQGIAISANNLMIVGDWGNQNIKIYKTDGSLHHTIPT